MTEPKTYNPSLHDNYFEDEIRNVNEILETIGYTELDIDQQEAVIMPSANL